MKVCYLDSMKLSLNLYGHKLPILSFDISSDNHLLVSASADKNIKIWGLDFGDIHKSMFIHQDSITCVQFIKETHYIMTCSKDKTVKFIDGDTHEEIFVFDNFFGEVWGLATSSIGDFFVTACADKCVRIWRQTKEQTFLIEQDEEREDKQMIKDAQNEYTEIDIAKENQIDPFSKDKVVKIEMQLASKRTTESLRYGEDLMDALELCESFRDEIDQYGIELEIYGKKAKHNKKAAKPEKPRASIKFLGRNIFEHIGLQLRRIRSSELENTLQFLNQKQSLSLLFYLEFFLRNGINTELATRAILSIVKTYQVSIK